MAVVAGAVLDTPRLRLRLLQVDSDDDHALYRNLYNDPDVMRRIAPPLGVEAAERGFRAACRHNLAAQPGHRFWRVDGKDTPEAIGLAALRRDGTRAEIGVMLFKGWWNRGICSEVFVALLEHGFLRDGVEVVDARSAEDDGLPVIERLLAPFGFIRVPTVVNDGFGYWVLPRDVWEAARARKPEHS